MHMLIAGIIFFAVFLLILALFFFLEDRRSREKRKLFIRLTSDQDKNKAGTNLDARMSGAFEKVLARYVDLKPLTRLMEEADVAIPVGRLLTFCAALGLGAFLLAALSIGHPLVMVLFTLIGLLSPIGYLLYKRSKREFALVSQLPDAVDMISRGLRAGQALDGALQEVVHSFPPPIGTELRQIYEEMAMGLSFEAAIRGFERRFYRVIDVRILCAALLIQRETGGNLTTILDNIAHTIRERFSFHRQVRALSAEGRLSALILSALPLVFCLFTWLVNPDYVHMLFHHPTGKTLVALALVLQGTGFATMVYLAKVKV